MGRQPKAVHYRAQDSFKAPLPPSGDSRLTAWPVQGTLTKVQKIWGNWALPALRSRRGGLPHLTPERTIFFSMAQSKFAPVQKKFLPKVDLKHDFGQQGFAKILPKKLADPSPALFGVAGTRMIDLDARLQQLFRESQAVFLKVLSHSHHVDKP